MMQSRWRLHRIGLLAAAGLVSGVAFAETIELVTYYPAPSTLDQHLRSLTVGTQYANQSPDDGEALVYKRLWVGNPFDPAAEFQVLTVVGNVWARSPTTALFIADRGANTNYSGLQLKTFGATQWTIGSQNDGTENLHLFSDADNATRMFIQQGTGNVGIGTTTPGGRLHVVGADDAVSNVLFMPGADTVANPAIPQIRVGIGTTAPASTLQLEGSLGMAVAVVAGNVTLSEAHNVILCNNGGAMTVNLPAAAQCAGRTYYIKKVSNNAATVTIDPNGAEPIDGDLTLTLYVWKDAVRIVSDGGFWHIISNELQPHKAKMRQDVAQSIPNQVFRKIEFSNEEIDVGNIATTTNGSPTGARFVIRRAGKYHVTALVWVDNILANGSVIPSIYKNGTAWVYSANLTPVTLAGAALAAEVTDVLDLVPGDFIEFYVYHAAGDGGPRNTTITQGQNARMSVIELP